ncbi:MAG: methionyl-tRNA formyltransferase [Deltaproteobacteria bacterium]|nr:methionyl-tRNA formyltransferase [Deltaproteobacteria bacterium]
MSRLRTVFMGSPEFAVPTLRAVMATTDLCAVVTQPDKPAGRGQKLLPPAVKAVAGEAGIPVLQPRSARAPEFLDSLKALQPDVAVVVAYGKILPQAVLDVPMHGCLNVHASLLPRYRGAAPIQWAIIRGEKETGVTIMRLDAGMDTGPMLISRVVPIADEDTAGTLSERLAKAGAELMVVALERLQVGGLVETPQDHAGATLAPLLSKEHGRIDWTKPAVELWNLVRGVDPWPGAYTLLGDELLKAWGAKVVKGSGEPGTVIDVDRDGLVVACGEGALALAELQLPGRKRMPARALVAGRPIPPGTRLG